MNRRLHIGGAVARKGWEVFDARPAEHVDHVGDARDLSRFAEGTFAELYASHVLEHFDYKDQLEQVLAEWHRVLAPGGVLRLSVPDLDILAHLLLRRHQLDINERFQVMRMIFGGHTHEFDYHYVGLNQDFLAAYLDRAGFCNLQRVGRHGLFPDCSESVVGGAPISLNLNAYKPAAAASAAAPAA